MRTSHLAALGVAACCAAALAQTPKLPLKSDDSGTLYVEPNVSPTEKSMESKGATVGAERPDGSAKYIGVDTTGTRPTYSLGGSTAGDLSYSAGVFSDGKEKKGVKAGVTLKY
ncbi:hypothetical protein QTI33_25040 [Variovorax sp. J22P271]|uniref:hypothetical protein n=1 Tax=Variovorax davisae TaxID=3053515 RepID=UPI0025782D5A|nr:hypothetical protein [Variovorax sp. J22P271]MDM0035423.1 hypothetical protein [Variovorax sp. J22P271]